MNLEPKRSESADAERLSTPRYLHLQPFDAPKTSPMMVSGESHARYQAHRLASVETSGILEWTCHLAGIFSAIAHGPYNVVCVT